MTKWLVIFVVSLASVVFLRTAMPVLAAGVLEPVCSSSEAAATEFCDNAENEEANRTFVYGTQSLFYTIVQIIIWLTGAISVLMIVIGGFRYVVSAGDSNGVQGAKNTILYALVGLVVAVFAQFIVSFVLSQFK